MSRLYSVVLWQARRRGAPEMRSPGRSETPVSIRVSYGLDSFSPASLGLLCGFQGQAADRPIFAPTFVSSNQVTEAGFARSGTRKIRLAAWGKKICGPLRKPRLVLGNWPQRPLESRLCPVGHVGCAVTGTRKISRGPGKDLNMAIAALGSGSVAWPSRQTPVAPTNQSARRK